MKTYKGKQITIKSFYQVIPWNQLETIMGKRNTKQFMKWMRGQTSTMEGCFPGDLERWLNNKPCID